MTLFEWSERLSIGIPSIDADHRTIVRLINELHDAILQRKGLGVLRGVLDELDEYSERHFRREENYFERFDYPDAAVHVAEHRELSGRVAAMRAAMERGEDVYPLEVLDFLRTWLARHIVETDAKYVPHLRRHGVE